MSPFLQHVFIVIFLFKINGSKFYVFRGFIETIDKPMLLIIEGKWLQAIVHMTKSEILNLPPPKQIQLLVSIHIHGNFHLNHFPIERVF
jgi:uncharacterized protein YlzI (FlbEa/FlbD family)